MIISNAMNIRAAAPVARTPIAAAAHAEDFHIANAPHLGTFSLPTQAMALAAPLAKRDGCTAPSTAPACPASQDWCNYWQGCAIEPVFVDVSCPGVVVESACASFFACDGNYDAKDLGGGQACLDGLARANECCGTDGSDPTVSATEGQTPDDVSPEDVGADPASFSAAVGLRANRKLVVGLLALSLSAAFLA